MKKILSFVLILCVLGNTNFLIYATESENERTVYNYNELPDGYNDPNIEYEYEMTEYGFNKLIGVRYKGVEYNYLYDSSELIEGISDLDGNQIVKYVYDSKGYVKNVQAYEDGKWIKNDDPDFIGNYNKMLYWGAYFDVKTNCYYIEGRYYNPKLDEYMNGEEDLEVLTDENPFSSRISNDESEVTLKSADTSELEAEQWAERLLASSSYGKPMTYTSSSWYTSLSNVEILARAIYCEGGTSYTSEDSAVAWVILNRTKSSSFPSAAIDVVTQKGQFSSIRGTRGSTSGARIVSTSTSRWAQSTFLACLLLTTTSQMEWREIVGDKINGQLYFYSYTTAKSNFNTSSSAFTGSTTSTLKYFGTAIKNVYVLGYGNVTSFNSLFNSYSPTAYSRNIYYDIK